MPLSDFVQVPVEDFGDRIEIAYEDGSRYRVTDYDAATETVTLRVVAHS